MNILITGGNGQLGRDCERVFKKNHATTCVDIEDLDITDKDQVSAMIRQIRPEVIVNCAAFTQVDACETQKEATRQVNVIGPENLAKSAREYGARLIQISTDYVFDGNKNPPDAYIETDAVAPLSYYGITKREGELAVINHLENHIILRTAWLYGFYGKNFLKTIVNKALNAPNTPLKIVNDQFGSPTWSFRLALQIAHLTENNGIGIYHAASEGFCSWFDFAVYFLKRLNINHEVIPCTTDEYPTPAVRPKCSILDNQRLKKENRNLMQHWQADLDEYVKICGKQLISECKA